MNSRSTATQPQPAQTQPAGETVPTPAPAASTPSTTAATQSATASSAALLQWEEAVIEIFANVAQLIGIPKSVGQIYGLLFCREQPMPMDDIISALQISKGSASQGLRMLRHLNAVHTSSLSGDRRDHYSAERALRKLVSGFLSEQIEPHLATGRGSLKTLDSLVNDLPAEAKATALHRIQTLHAWNGKTAKLLPMLRVFL